MAWAPFLVLLLVQACFGPAAGQTSAALFTNGTKFLGMERRNNPTEPNAAVGRNHIVEVINSRFYTVFDKSGLPLFPPQATTNGAVESMTRFFNPDTQPSCASRVNTTDVLVLYDKWADRWLMAFTTTDTTHPYRFCLLVSDTPDPTGTFTGFEIEIPGVIGFYDFPKMGIWPSPVQANTQNNGYYVTFNLKTDQRLVVINRDDVLNRVPSPRQQNLAIPGTVGGIPSAVLPADVDGWAFPPVGEPGILMGAAPGTEQGGENRDFLLLWRVAIDWTTTPVLLTITSRPDIPVDNFTVVPRRTPPNGPPVPQPGTPQMLDGRGSMLMYRLPYRNFGTHDAIVATHAVLDTAVTPSVGRVRWYQIQGFTTGGTVEVDFQGTFGTGTTWRWCPTIAMDSVGSIAVGYSMSSATVFPSMAVTGRLASDPDGVMLNSDQIVFSGSGVEETDRWGDYFSMAIDPVDDRTFWFTSSFVGDDSGSTWSGLQSFQLGATPTDICVAQSPMVRGYGCDMIDNNCNGEVDDCLEDVTPPTILVSEYSYGSKCFNSQADAEHFFITNSFVEDDCTPPLPSSCCFAMPNTVSSCPTGAGAFPACPPQIQSAPLTFYRAEVICPGVGGVGTFQCFSQPLSQTVVAPGSFEGSCAQSTLTLTATDACNNQGSNTVMFSFDNAPPTVTVDAAKIPNVCFTSQAVAENAILQATTVSDVCAPDSRNIAVSISSFDKKCAASTATVKAVDLCENVNTVIWPINFDDQPPVITIDAAAINAVCLTSQAAAEALILEKTTVTDNCTPANEIVKTIVHFEENCAFSRAVVEAVDGCGNKATEEVRFNFDDKAPSLLVSEYALGSKWFTQAAYASIFFLTNTFSQDDCTPQANIAKTFTNLVKNCAATTATLSVTDACGNVASSELMFPYDDVAPVVTLSVAQDKIEEKAGIKGAALVDVGLAITATDVCTPNPNVTVRVYSDELYLKDADSWKASTVQLSRVESAPGVVTGWKLLVAAEAFDKCNIRKYACGGNAPQKGNGRVYTIVACATDETGLRTCKETNVEVTPKGAKVTTVINDGKNYLMAMDDVNKFGTL